MADDGKWWCGCDDIAGPHVHCAWGGAGRHVHRAEVPADHREEPPPPAPPPVPDISPGDPVADLWDGSGWSAVSTRTINTIGRYGVKTAGQLTALTAADLRDFRGLGTGGVAEVRRVLGEHGLALKGETEADCG